MRRRGDSPFLVCKQIDFCLCRDSSYYPFLATIIAAELQLQKQGLYAAARRNRPRVKRAG
jgi:hypothetical protein